MRRFLLLLLLLPVAAVWAYGCGDQLTQPQVEEPEPSSEGSTLSARVGAKSLKTPRTWHRVPRDYATIREAIDAAQPGDGILVGPGEHVGAIINKPVYIRGEKGAVINAGQNPTGHTALYMRPPRFGDAHGTVIENLVIEGNANMWQGIGGWAVNNVTVRQNTIRNVYWGIFANSAYNWTIEDNVIEGGSDAYGTGGVGISLGAFGIPQAGLGSGGDHEVIDNTISVAGTQGTCLEAVGIWLHIERFEPASLTGNLIQGNEIRELICEGGYWAYGIEITDVWKDGATQPTDNKIVENEFGHFRGEPALSCVDQTAGRGTAGTANLWDDNEAKQPSYPLGICGEVELASFSTASQNVSADVIGAQDIHRPPRVPQ